MIYREFGFKSCSGLDLFACTWGKEENTMANIILIHGLGEHSGRYKEIAEILVHKGYNVYAFDHLGFGKSSGKRGHVSSFDIYFNDIYSFVQLVKDLKPAQNTFILGHSMGGLLSLTFGIKYPLMVDGYIITSPALKGYPIPPTLMIIVNIFNYLLPRITLKNPIPVDKLSHKREVVETYIKDPLVHTKVTARFVKELLKTIEFTGSNGEKFKDNLLLMYAGKDYIVDPSGVQEFARSLQSDVNKKIICYNELYHEILNEDKREDILEIVDNWIREFL